MFLVAVLSRLAEKGLFNRKIWPAIKISSVSLGQNGINYVEFYICNGRYGQPKQRHVGKIIITSAVPKTQEPLVEQVADYNNLVFRFYRAQGPHYFCG